MIPLNATPFQSRPRTHEERDPRLPSGPLLPSDTQAIIAMGIEESALDTLKRRDGRKVALTKKTRPAPGVREITAYDVAGELIGVSVVCGWSDEP